MNDTSTRNRGTAVEDRTTTGTAGSSIVLGVVGIIAGVGAINGFYPVLLGAIAVVVGLITLIPALTAWQRGRKQHGEAAGTTGTNLSIGGVIAAVAAIVLGAIGITTTGDAETVDEGADAIEQEADELGDDVDDGF